MLPEPTLTHRAEGGHDIPLLVWRLPEPVRSISSAVLGGGIGECRWLVNASVPMSYDRDDPAAHLAEIARDLALDGPGIGLLTGVDVADVVGEEDGGVRLWATVGLGAPIQAADPEHDADEPHLPGTVNIVAWVPRRLSDGALVNAVATITEAKTQAIRDLGLAATGTATDAICVLCPHASTHATQRADAPQRTQVAHGADSALRAESAHAVETDHDADGVYGGPRSRWGRHLARATYRAVLAGGRVNLTGTPSWSDRNADRLDRAQ